MKTKLLRKARALYNSPHVSKSLNRRNQLSWARAVKSLGEKWLHSTLITKGSKPKHRFTYCAAVGWPTTSLPLID